jgi:hypothetical protein
MSKFILFFFLQNYSGASRVIHFTTESRTNEEIEEFLHNAEVQVSPKLMHNICHKASVAVAHLKK